MQFVKESIICATPGRVFAFHLRGDALRRLTPPWERSKLISQAVISEIGSRTIIKASIFWPFSTRWIAEHTAYDPPRMFEDVQIGGPFRVWRHRHLIAPHADGAILRDEIDYEPPLGWLGRMATPMVIEPRLEKLFAYRHEVTVEWCEGKDEG